MPEALLPTASGPLRHGDVTTRVPPHVLYKKVALLSCPKLNITLLKSYIRRQYEIRKTDP